MGQVLAWEVIRANTFTFDFFLQKLSDVDSRLQQIPSFLLAAKAKVSKTLHFDLDFTFPGGLSSSSLHTITGRTANSIALYNITIYSVLHHIFSGDRIVGDRRRRGIGRFPGYKLSFRPPSLGPPPPPCPSPGPRPSPPPLKCPLIIEENVSSACNHLSCACFLAALYNCT